MRYIISIAPWPAYRDFHQVWAAAAARYDWLEIMTRRAFAARLPELCKDERNFLIVWGYRCPVMPEGRKATCAIGYSEAFDDDRSKMYKGHARWLNDCQVSQFPQVDGVLCHTPWMAMKVTEGLDIDGHVLPMGWDPVLGARDFTLGKPYRFTYNGVMAGKREWLVPAMKEALGLDFTDVTGQWVARLNRSLNQSWASLYLTHSDVQSFSTFRIWQTLCSSSTLVAERGRDCWPMTEEMYVGIPTLTQDNVVETARSLQAMGPSVLLDKREALWDSLNHMTIDHVLENYLVPASLKIRESKVS